MAKSARKASDPNPYRPNIWGMIQNVLINATNRGQITLGFIGMIILISIIKMPPADITKLWMKTISIFESLYMYGWIIAAFVTIFSVILFNLTRKRHKTQILELIESMKPQS